MPADRFRDWPRLRLRCPSGGQLEVRLADRLRRRLLGLALLEPPPRGGILITRCASIHTVGMRFAIDVAFVAWPPRKGDVAIPVLVVRKRVPPLRRAACSRRDRAGRGRAVAALEVAAGGVPRLGIEAGAELALTP